MPKADGTRENPLAARPCDEAPAEGSCPKPRQFQAEEKGCVLEITLSSPAFRTFTSRKIRRKGKIYLRLPHSHFFSRFVKQLIFQSFRIILVVSQNFSRFMEFQSFRIPLRFSNRIPTSKKKTANPQHPASQQPVPRTCPEQEVSQSRRLVVESRRLVA